MDKKLKEKLLKDISKIIGWTRDQSDDNWKVETKMVLGHWFTIYNMIQQSTDEVELENEWVKKCHEHDNKLWRE